MGTLVALEEVLAAIMQTLGQKRAVQVFIPVRRLYQELVKVMTVEVSPEVQILALAAVVVLGLLAAQDHLHQVATEALVKHPQFPVRLLLMLAAVVAVDIARMALAQDQEEAGLAEQGAL
jgi:hypothetical protein